MMTIFINEAAADTPPCWRQPHHPLSVPDWLGLLLVKPRKPDDVRKEWRRTAELERDQTVRDLKLDDYGDNGLPLRHWDLDDMTPAAAWWWFCTTSKPPGHRVVLVDPSKPNLLEEMQ